MSSYSLLLLLLLLLLLTCASSGLETTKKCVFIGLRWGVAMKHGLAGIELPPSAERGLEGAPRPTAF